MNIAGIIFDCINVHDGVATEIYVSGCYHNCNGCHNPEMQDFNYGEPLDLVKLVTKLKEHQDWFDIISIIGGDLLCQPSEEARNFSWALRLEFLDKKMWLFTGKEKEDIPDWCFEIFDVIKTGRYMKELESANGLISSNQKLLYQGKDY